MKLFATLRSRRSGPPFPPGFLFGVATADHQCEAYDPDCEDIRDVWEREHNLVGRGKATDFENRYEEDVELARQLGCKAFRFSIAWSRVEPSAGHFDEARFDYYRRLIAAIRGAGMEPILTLHHFTWPVHVQQRGGMIAPDFPAMFARYVAQVVRQLGPDVRYWITFNEPSQLLYGYIKPWWVHDYFVPPGLPVGATPDDQTAAVGQLIHNLFRAHTEARRIIKASNPDAQVGANPLLLGLPVWLQRLVDWNAMRIKGEDDLGKQVRRCVGPPVRPTAVQAGNSLGRALRQLLDPLVKQYSILSTVLASNWWHLGMAGKLPEFLCPSECVGQQDFIGLDYYWGISTFRVDRISALIDAGLGRFERAPVWPGALHGHLKHQAHLLPGLPLLIIENGSVDLADEIDRATYLRQHIRQVQKAMRDGVDIGGYFCWAITSNREWGLPFGKGSDFGLYHIDLDTDPLLTRVPTPAAEVYRDILQRREP